jgi:formylglycine-generating enzyme required for sulfatase activity
LAPVGTTTRGVGRWGQLDLVGEVFQWNLDWYAPYVNPCHDCAYLAPAADREIRGGDFGSGQSYLPSASRYYNVPGADKSTTPPDYRLTGVGFRCRAGSLSSVRPPSPSSRRVCFAKKRPTDPEHPTWASRRPRRV